MSIKPVRWKQVKAFDAKVVDQTPISSCYLAKVFRYETIRNAYHGYYSQLSWDPQDSTDINERTFKRRIEDLRQRGTRFVIREIPAIVMASDSRALVAFGFHSRPAVEGPARRKIAGSTFGDLVASLRRTEGDFLLFATSSRPPNAALPFQFQSSIGRPSANAPLKWSYSETGEDIARVASLIRKIVITLNNRES